MFRGGKAHRCDQRMNVDPSSMRSALRYLSGAGLPPRLASS